MFIVISVVYVIVIYFALVVFRMFFVFYCCHASVGQRRRREPQGAAQGGRPLEAPLELQPQPAALSWSQR